MREYTKLCDVCDFQGGSQPPKDEWSFDLKAGYIRMLQIRDFTQSERVVPEYIKITKTTKTCEADDILIARYGASLGKILTGLAGAYNVAIMKAIPDTNMLEKKYLYYYLKSPIFQGFLLNVGSRAAQAGFNKNDLQDLLIPNITRNEQVEIVGILERVETVIEVRQKELQKLDNLLKARFVEMFGDVIHNSKKWQVCLFAEITSSRLGKMLDAKQQTGRNSYPYLANFNVQWFRFNLENLNKMDFDEKDRAEFELREGDLLVCEGGEIGRCAVWHNELQPCFFQKALHRVRCNHQIILPDYLAWWFRYNCDYGGFSALAGAKATIAHLPGAKLKQLQVAVPPMELQEQFAVFVAQTDKSKVAVRKY